MVLAALVTSASPVPVMTFFPGLLSGFLAYLYAWYCLRIPSVKGLRGNVSTGGVYSILVYTCDITVPELQVFKERSLWVLSFTK